MPSKNHMRRRFLEIMSFSKSKHHEIIDHHAHILPNPIIHEQKVEVIPNSVKAVEIYGFTKEGSGPSKSECQDTFSVLNNLAHHVHYFAVYDGHGPNGKLVSEYVNKTISASLKANAMEMEQAVDMGSADVYFKTLFKAVDNKLLHSSINPNLSGSCCISVLISNNKCYIANLGDSRAILCRQSNLGQVSVLDLSTDHKPTRQDEQARILQVGGIIEPSYSDGKPIGPLRLWSKTKDSGLAMTRGFGDAKGKEAGLSSEPEMTHIDLTPNEKFIIIASDGVWDVMNSSEAVSFVLNYLAAGRSKSDASKALTLEAKSRWSKLDVYEEVEYCDDITVVIAFLSYHPAEIGTVVSHTTQTQIPSYKP